MIMYQLCPKIVGLHFCYVWTKNHCESASILVVLHPTPHPLKAMVLFAHWMWIFTWTKRAMMRTPFFFPRASSKVLNKVLFQWIRWSYGQTERQRDRETEGHKLYLRGHCCKHVYRTLLSKRVRSHQLGVTEGFLYELLEQVYVNRDTVQNFFHETGKY